jgi:hypothetical protein
MLEYPLRLEWSYWVMSSRRKYSEILRRDCRRPGGLRPMTRWGVVRDLGFLTVFAVLRGGLRLAWFWLRRVLRRRPETGMLAAALEDRAAAGGERGAACIAGGGSRVGCGA